MSADFSRCRAQLLQLWRKSGWIRCRCCNRRKPVCLCLWGLLERENNNEYVSENMAKLKG